MGSDDGTKTKRREPRLCMLFAAFVSCVCVALVMIERPVDDIVVPMPPRRRSLKARLIEIAALPAAEALKALDADPLGVNAVTNASDWTCPSERLVTREPSVAAERKLRSLEGFLWFEHLSKAGGTSFCTFARKNVSPRRTPSYYCMPSDGARIAGTDGRVGRWTADQIRDYVARTHHVVLANEWDAFPGMDEFRDDAVLATVVRDPVDRLVSAYNFWGKTHNPNPNPPPCARWLETRDRNARKRPHALFPDDFLSQVGRDNFATWKFGSSLDPARLHDCGTNRTCDLEALNIALDRLERFHIAPPMLWQAHAAPLYHRLGWTDTQEVHKVPSGTIHNSGAKRDLGDNYERFRERNVFDFVLWAFVRRAFLERVHCPRTPVA